MSDSIQKINLIDIDLSRGNIHRSWCGYAIGMKDNNGDAFGIRVFRNRGPVDLTGISVQGFFRNSVGTNIAITSGNTVSGNTAYVVLPQACYDYDGPFTLAIKLIGGGVTGTMRIIDGMVDNTNTSGAVAPTGAVPTYQEVLSVFEQMQDALEDYDDVVATQNAQISDLKSAFGTYPNSVAAAVGPVPISFSESGYYTTPENGSAVSRVENADWVTRKFPVTEGDTVTMNVTGVSGNSRSYVFIDASGNAIGRCSANLSGFYEVRVPANAVYMAINNKIASQPDGYWALKGEPLKDTVNGIINAVGVENNLTNTWESGAINSSNGGKTTSTTRIRFYSYIYAGLKMTISAPSGMKFMIFRYADETVESYKRSEGWFTGEKTVYYPNEYIKVVAAYSDDSEISASAGDNVIRKTYTVTDESLSQKGKGADANAVGEQLAKKFEFNGILDNTQDLNDIRGNAFYRWMQSSRPAHLPTSYGGTLISLGISSNTTQLIINYVGKAWIRGYYSSSWSDWMPVADDTILKSIIETITVPESIASITGNDGVTYTASGITMTKVSDHEFTLTGNTLKKVPKCFNVLLGSNQITTSNDTVLTKNITTPGTYTVSYTAVESTVGNHLGNLFAITDGKAKTRKYLKNGEPFVVGVDPVCLFVYAPTDLKLYSRTLTVKWALYVGEEGAGIPYSEDSTAPIAIDARARNYAMRTNKEEKQSNEYISWGKANALANARQIMDIKWTPVADTMPMGQNAYYQKDVEYTGLPYSSVRDNAKAVGTNVSIHTFMTALQDPNSVLYTRKSTTDNASTYYGTVCSGLCNHAYGIGLNLTNYFLGASDWFETVPMQDLQSGDMIYISGHVAMIFDVTKDEYGRIDSVTVIEEWFPNTRYKRYSSYEGFLSGRSGYIARRFKGLSGVPYVQSPYIRCFDEEEEEVTYPDVQTDHGDAAVFGYCAGAGSSFTDYANVSGITVNVINQRDFTNITVTREGASSAVFTTGNIQSFTIPAADIVPGLYTITATGTEYTSVSTFFVADVNGAWNAETGVITFSSSNATPVLAEIYNLPMEGGKYKPTNQDMPLNDADRTAGTINAFDRVDRGYAYCKVTFDTPYGQAVWRSEAHPTWEPIE